jgi:hypothetical protein
MRSRYPHVWCLFLTFAIATPLCPPVLAQDSLPDSGDILPVAVETVRPSRGRSHDVPLRPPRERPEVHSVDPATWERWKEEARNRRGAAPPDSIVPIETAATEALVTSFPGLLWSQVTPSDVNVAKSGFRILQVANSQIRLTNTAGATLAGRTLTDFFGAPDTGYYPFDPRVIFDRAGGANVRFYVVAVQNTPGAPNVSTIWLAVSRSANPDNLDAASWCLYAINGLRNAGTADESFPDFPGLGAGSDALLISTNQFRFSNNSFTYAILRAINKATLANNATACPTLTTRVYQPAATIGDLDTFDIQPAVHSTAPSSFTGTTNPAYAVSASGKVVGSFYRVYRVRNVASGSPTLTTVTVNASSSYALPPDATQSGGGTTYKLETGDARILKVAAVGDSLWASQTTECAIGASPNEACARILRINVGQNSSGTMTGTLAQQITFGGDLNNFYFMPVVAANDAQRTAVAFLWSSSGRFLTSAWTAKNASSTIYEAATKLTDGTCLRAESTAPIRVGDYAGAQVNPNDGTSFWITAEDAAYWPPGSTTYCVWESFIANVN